jgi:3-hydroxybutyryl-CoA dehydratase
VNRSGAVRVARPQPPYAGRKFSQFRVGDRFGDQVSVPAERLNEAAQLIGDYNPLHVDAEFARASRFGGTILHGVITSALMSAPFGNLVAGTAIGYLEHNARFLLPVRPGDTLQIEWRVVALHPKPARRAGIVEAECEARNQRGELVATATGKMLVGEGS